MGESRAGRGMGGRRAGKGMGGRRAGGGWEEGGQVGDGRKEGRQVYVRREFICSFSNENMNVLALNTTPTL